MLPEAFLTRMKAQLGGEYGDFLKSLERPRAVALRFNPLKGERPELPFVRQNVPWEGEGFYYDPESRPGLHVYHEAGVYYLQEASAMAPVALLDPQPGEKVCDLCAAPGGKTTQIAGRMGGQGFLLCNEINPKRAKILSRNIERMAVPNALVTNEHPANLAKKYPGFFDRVLVDAPCSGEGMFSKEEAAVTDWSQETVEMCARRQAEILHSAAQLVRPGGRLVYSTCTFAPRRTKGRWRISWQSIRNLKRNPRKLPGSSPEKTEATACGPISCWVKGILLPFCAKLGEKTQRRHFPRGKNCPKSGRALPKSWALGCPGARRCPLARTSIGCLPICRTFPA